MSFWEELEQRQLPTETVPLPVEGGTVSVVLRALPPAEWDALCEEFKVSDPEQAAQGVVNLRDMRWALLAACIVAPDGAPPKTPAWWEQLAKRGGTSAGELDYLVDRAMSVNRRAPMPPDLGKD